jgi:hypothetical protein
MLLQNVLPLEPHFTNRTNANIFLIAFVKKTVGCQLGWSKEHFTAARLRAFEATNFLCAFGRRQEIFTVQTWPITSVILKNLFTAQFTGREICDD